MKREKAGESGVVIQLRSRLKWKVRLEAVFTPVAGMLFAAPQWERELHFLSVRLVNVDVSIKQDGKKQR